MKKERRKRTAARTAKLERRREERRARDGRTAVLRAMASQAFLARFRAAAGSTAPASLEAVRIIALAVLRDMGVDTSGALLTFSWDPTTGQLGVWCRPPLKKLAAPSVAAGDFGSNLGR